MQLYIGCSGYYYNHWLEKFYPKGLAKNKWLAFPSLKLRVPKARLLDNFYLYLATFKV